MRDVFLNPAGVGVVRVGTIVIVAAVAALLFVRRDLPLGSLRALEILLFVAVAVHILVLDHGLLLQEVATGDAGLVLSRWNLTSLSFVLLMATCAIFVPNTWARAATVIQPLAAAPIVLGLVVRARHPEVRSMTDSVLTTAKITDVVFLLTIAAIVSILGALLIDRFRNVALDARSANFYDLEERIGQGGMGEVWLARHQTLARPAAIKIIRPELLDDGDRGTSKLATLRFGTPAYMPPELAMEADLVGPGTDVYALGCVAYWLLTGKYVFDQPTPMAMVVEHVKTLPAAPSTRTELQIPVAFDEVILKCLEKDPSDRFTSMRELSEVLSAIPLNGSCWGPAAAEDCWGLHQPSPLQELPNAS